MRKTLLFIFSTALIFGLFSAVRNMEAGAQKYGGAGKKPAVSGEKTVNAAACYECHGTVKDLHKSGKHAGVNCVNCHKGLEKHLKDQAPETRPATDTSWEACGKCHSDQYDSFMNVACTGRRATRNPSSPAGRPTPTGTSSWRDTASPRSTT